MRPRVRLCVHRLFGGPPDRPAEEERARAEFEAISVGPGVQRDRREGDAPSSPPTAREALAMVQDPRPSAASYYTKRFMHALGSRRTCTRTAPRATCRRNSGLTQAIGAGELRKSDVANCKMTMFIGRSYADAIRPSSVVDAAAARARRARYIVLVDPRCNNSQRASPTSGCPSTRAPTWRSCWPCATCW